MSLEGLNKRLSNARREKGLTQNELAMKLGVTSQAVSKWERGSSYPDIEMLDHIANILECSIDYLFQHNVNYKIFQDRQTIERKEQIDKAIWKDSIIVEVSFSLVDMIKKEEEENFLEIHNLRMNLAEQCGIYVPIIRIKDNINLEENTYRFIIGGIIIEGRKLDYPKKFYRVQTETSLQKGVWKEETEETEEGISAFAYLCRHLQICILKLL